MLGLAAPAWLAALAALAVPIAIHLWTRRRARVVRVASIRHIAGEPGRARRLRLDDPWLLLARVALIAVVVAMLARPYLSIGDAPVPETWVLVEPAMLHDADRLLDSLHRSGASMRLLAPGLPEIDWDARPATSAAGATPPDAWSLLREAEHVAPAGTKLLIVAEPQLAADAGERPVIGLEVNWTARRLGDSVAQSRGDRATRPQGDEPATRSATVFAEAERRDDARYIAAAIEAAAEPSLAAEGVRVLPPNDADSAVAGAGPGDWLVWLSAAPLPDALTRALRDGATVLTDSALASADAMVERGWTGPTARALVLSDGMPPVAIRQGVGTAGVVRTGDAVSPPAAADAAVLWKTADGVPLLTARRVGMGLHLVHAGRFDARSTDLVLQPVFPELIARLWEPAEALRAGPVPVSVRQILPVRGPRSRATSDPSSDRDLTDTIWPVALTLLVFERLLATRPRRPRTAAAA